MSITIRQNTWLGLIRNLRAKSAVFIALLKEIHIMLIRFNLRIDVRYVHQYEG